MQHRLSEIAPSVWAEVEKLNESLRDVWSNSYPKTEIDEYNEYRADKARKKEKQWKPIQHFAPVQYPDYVFMPTIESATEIQRRSTVDADNIDAGLSTQADRLLLFIGLNPSSPDTNVLAKLHEYETRQDKYDEIVEHEAAVWDSYDTYFGPIRSFRTPLHKYHVDLFAIRHTNAKVVEDFMCGAWCKTATQRASVHNFFLAQFDALHRFLQKVCPSQAILINAFAGRILTGQTCLNHGHPYQEDLVKWIEYPARITHPSWTTYLHSSGMMSSGNMDNGSKTRLEAISHSVYRNGKILI